jgi:FkbM family methyltransferase
LAIEANPQVYGRYQKVNSEYQQIQYINVGLSNRRKISPFYVPKVTDPSTSIFGSFQKLPIYDYYNPTPVKIEKLDSIVRNFRLKSERIALWIDVEGELGRLIQGARKTLSDYSVKLLYCEVQENNHYNDEKTAMEISQELWSLGFVPVARDFPTAPLYNLIFLRKDMIERVNPLLLSHLEDLQKIKLPFFVVPDYKTPLSRIKKFILRPNSKLWHKMVNSIAAILGSSSSKRENQP